MEKDKWGPNDELPTAGHLLRHSSCGMSAQPFLDHARFAEAEVGAAAVVGRADHDVVEEADLQERGGFREAAGEAVVGVARGGVAGGVIVDHDDTVGCISNGRSKDFARMNQTVSQGPNRNLM